MHGVRPVALDLFLWFFFPDSLSTGLNGSPLLRDGNAVSVGIEPEQGFATVSSASMATRFRPLSPASWILILGKIPTRTSCVWPSYERVRKKRNVRVTTTNSFTRLRFRSTRFMIWLAWAPRILYHMCEVFIRLVPWKSSAIAVVSLI